MIKPNVSFLADKILQHEAETVDNIGADSWLSDPGSISPPPPSSHPFTSSVPGPFLTRSSPLVFNDSAKIKVGMWKGGNSLPREDSWSRNEMNWCSVGDTVIRDLLQHCEHEEQNSVRQELTVARCVICSQQIWASKQMFKPSKPSVAILENKCSHIMTIIKLTGWMSWVFMHTGESHALNHLTNAGASLQSLFSCLPTPGRHISSNSDPSDRKYTIYNIKQWTERCSDMQVVTTSRSFTPPSLLLYNV